MELSIRRLNRGPVSLRCLPTLYPCISDINVSVTRDAYGLYRYSSDCFGTMLCEQCRARFDDPHVTPDRGADFFLPTSTLPAGQIHHAAHESFAAALSKGCGICWRILESALRHRSGGGTKIFHDDGNLKPSVEASSFRIHHAIALSREGRDYVQLQSTVEAKIAGKTVRLAPKQFFFLSPSQAPLPDAGEQAVSNSTSSSTSIEILEDWIAECKQNHVKCHRTRSHSSPHPFARTIDVGDSIEQNTVRLCNPEAIDPNAQYLTLSHCWGGVNDIHMLTKANYGSQFEGIEIAALPKTFREAVYLTRRLRIRYLWIDSLCIVQDSAQDWDHEARCMGAIYQNSYLNIAATASVNPHGGLFRTRPVPLTKALRVAIWLPTARSPDYEDRCISSSISLEKPIPDAVEGFEDFAFPALVLWNQSYEGGYRTKITLDINQCLGNNNGAFDKERSNFAASARGIVLHGTVLHAELRDLQRQWRHSSIDIDGFSSHHAATIKALEKVYYEVDIDYADKWTRQVYATLLCRRAWVVQERVLAPRVVHFADRQLFWECEEHVSLEQSPRSDINAMPLTASAALLDLKRASPFGENLSLVSERYELSPMYVWMSLLAMVAAKNVGMSRESVRNDSKARLEARTLCYGDDQWETTSSVLRYWASVITTYGSCGLTRLTDRLIAIDGLVQILKARSGMAYIAGMWRHHFVRQLLWSVVRTATDEAVDTSHIAPTWSWASSVGSVGVRDLLPNPLTDESGAMELVKVEFSQNSASSVRMQENAVRVRGRLLPVTLDAAAWPEGATRENMLVQYWTASTRTLPKGDTFLVPLAFILYHSRIPLATPNALIVEATATTGVYRRIGTARLSHHCTLRQVVPQLYAATVEDHIVDSTADSIIETEAAALSTSKPSTIAQEPDGPLQNFYRARMAALQSPAAQRGVDMLKAKLDLAAAKQRSARATSQRAAAEAGAETSAQQAWSNVTKLLSRGLASQAPVARTTSANKLPSTKIAASEASIVHQGQDKTMQAWQDNGDGAPTDLQRLRIEDSASHENGNLQAQMTGDAASSAGTGREDVDRRSTYLAPKDAIASHFYLEYLEDEDSTRYGCFVFDII